MGFFQTWFHCFYCKPMLLMFVYVFVPYLCDVVRLLATGRFKSTFVLFTSAPHSVILYCIGILPSWFVTVEFVVLFDVLLRSWELKSSLWVVWRSVCPMWEINHCCHLFYSTRKGWWVISSSSAVCLFMWSINNGPHQWCIPYIWWRIRVISYCNFTLP